MAGMPIKILWPLLLIMQDKKLPALEMKFFIICKGRIEFSGFANFTGMILAIVFSINVNFVKAGKQAKDINRCKQFFVLSIKLRNYFQL
jgi:hypothetical protein